MTHFVMSFWLNQCAENSQGKRICKSDGTKKIEEIRDEILDHEYIFQDVKLTEAEEKELR